MSGASFESKRGLHGIGHCAPVAPLIILATVLLFLSPLAHSVTIVNTQSATTPDNFSHPASLFEMGYDPQNGLVYVTNGGSSTVGVVNPATGQILSNVAVGTFPWGIAFDSASGNLYVACGGGADVTASTVSVINPSTTQVIATIRAGVQIAGIAYDPVNTDVYVASTGTPEVTVISAQSNTVIANVTLPLAPEELVYDTGKNFVYVAEYGTGFRPGNAVAVIDGSSNSVVGSVTVGGYPMGLAYDPSDNYVFVANSADNTVSVISDTANTVVATVAVSGSPWSIAYDGADKNVYVSLFSSNQVVVVSADTLRVIGTIAVGVQPQGILYAGTYAKVLVALNSGYVDVIDPSKLQLSDLIGAVPFTVSYGVVGGPGSLPPTLQAESNGIPISATVGATPATFYLDPGSAWGISNPLPGSGSNSRWETTQETNGTANTNETESLVYYEQVACHFYYRVVGGSNGSLPPQVGYTQFGTKDSNHANFTDWVDVGSVYSYPAYLSTPSNPTGANSSERWASPAPLKAAASSPSSVIRIYYHQYPFTSSYKLQGEPPSGGSGPSPPTLAGVTFGQQVSLKVLQSQTSSWLDANTGWQVPNHLAGNVSTLLTDRWLAAQVFSGTLTGPLDREFVYYHQLSATFTYMAYGGGSPPFPSLNVTVFGKNTAFSVNATMTKAWVDSGTDWVAQRSLRGSVSGERWQLSGASSGVVTSSYQSLAYYHQYLVTVTNLTPQGGNVTSAGGWYNASSSLRLVAAPNPGWQFTGWTGTGTGSYSGTLATTSLSVNNPILEEARFSQQSASVGTGFFGGLLPPVIVAVIAVAAVAFVLFLRRKKHG